MAIKKKVTYSVSYVAGTDTLTTKLNSLLDDIVSLITGHNSGLSIVDRITVGSSRFSGAPLYDTYVSTLYSVDFNNRHYESDVVFIGTDEDNLCLSLGFFDGQLVIAMNVSPAAEEAVTDIWSSTYNLTTLPLFAIGKASRWFNRATAANYYSYSLPYAIVNDTISMSVIYWTGSYSSGYSFVNGSGQTDGFNLVIFATDEGNSTTGIGAAIWQYSLSTNCPYKYNQIQSLLAFSFAEDITSHLPVQLTSDNSGQNVLIDTGAQVLANGRTDWRQWFSANNSSAYGLYGQWFGAFHTLGAAYPEVATNNIGVQPGRHIPDVGRCLTAIQATMTSSAASTTGYCAAPMVYNLPYLSTGQAYVRKMRIPGWNPNCKGEIYLLWSPVLTGYAPGDILEIGSKQYAMLTPGAVCWAARVA